MKLLFILACSVITLVCGILYDTQKLAGDDYYQQDDDYDTSELAAKEAATAMEEAKKATDADSWLVPAVVTNAFDKIEDFANKAGGEVKDFAGEKAAKLVSEDAIKKFILIDSSLREFCGKENLNMANVTESIWWPGCGYISKMSEFAASGSGGGQCPADGCVKKATMEEMDAFNTKNGGKRVSYNARAGKDKEGKDIEVVKLTGWWLPAPNAREDTPRIVVQHGFHDNSNKFRTMFTAYLLRKLGYSVLVNNLRDHCYSEDSSPRVIGWGHAFPLDLLGAWDYLKEHAPAPIDASQVGIWGCSMGAFTTLNAFGLEPEIPAVWVDGPPFTPKAGFEVGFKSKVEETVTPKAGSRIADFASGYLVNYVYEDIEAAALKKGVDLNEHLPEKELPNGPDTKRKVFLTANKHDNTVPYSSAGQLEALLKKYPEKYDLVEFWTLDDDCNGETHCIGFLSNMVEYSEKLGKFWAGVFGGK